MRTRFKSFKAVLLALLALVFVLSACGSGSNGGNNSNANTGQQGTSNSSSSNDGEKPYELVVAFMHFGNDQRDTDLIAEEVSKITKEKINATIKLMPLSVSAYTQQMNLMLSGNEKLDLLFVSAANHAPFVNRGQLVELDDLLDKHGQGIKNEVGDFLEAARVNGKIYVIPTVREYAASYGFAMRKDLVDKHNIDVSAINSFEDVGDVLRIIKQNEPGVNPLVGIVPGRGAIDFGYFADDRLGDNFGVLPQYDNDMQIVNRFEQDYYVEKLQMLHEWYKEGLIQQDIATTQSSRQELFQANKAFAWFNHTKPGYEVQTSLEMGTEIVVANITEPISTTSDVMNVNWGIARNSNNPELAMQFLNLMYTDPEITNLLSYGIEGKHYVHKEGGVIGYPEGVTSEDHGYNYNLGWMWGNQLLTHVWEGNPADLWEQIRDFNNRSIKSAGLGFNFDSSAVQTEFASVTNVLDQYQVGLETGTLDPAKMHEDFVNRLKAAGIDKIIEEKQKQFDAWRAANQ